MGRLTGHRVAASGATAVQIASTKRGKQTILEHLGSAHDEIELAALIAAARAKLTAGQLAIARDLQNRTGVSIRRIVQELRPLRDVTINELGHDLTATTPPSAAAAEILDALRQTRTPHECGTSQAGLPGVRRHRDAGSLEARAAAARRPDRG